MVFSKEYIRNFAFSLSERKDVLTFRKRDKLNGIIRSYIEVAPRDHIHVFNPDAVTIIVPVNTQVSNYPPSEHLPERNYKHLENDFEDIFFSLFHKIDSAGVLSNGKRKEAREKFLAICGITSEEISEDAFRKLFDRYRKKKEAQITDFLKKSDINLVTLYRSGAKNFLLKTPKTVQLLS